MPSGRDSFRRNRVAPIRLNHSTAGLCRPPMPTAAQRGTVAYRGVVVLSYMPRRSFLVRSFRAERGISPASSLRPWQGTFREIPRRPLRRARRNESLAPAIWSACQTAGETLRPLRRAQGTRWRCDHSHSTWQMFGVDTI